MRSCSFGILVFGVLFVGCATAQTPPLRPPPSPGPSATPIRPTKPPATGRVPTATDIAAQTTLPERSHPLSPTPSPSIAKITGWFTTIWNGEPHYTLTAEDGQRFELVLDDEPLRNAGGWMQVDRKRVTITGIVLTETPLRVQVLSLQLNP